MPPGKQLKEDGCDRTAGKHPGDHIDLGRPTLAEIDVCVESRHGAAGQIMARL